MNSIKLEEIISQNQGTFIDVRTRDEFSGGHVAGSINIPLQEIPDQVPNLKKMKMPLILCCASGGRSSQAQRFLAQMGIDCINAGSWLTLNALQAQYEIR